MRQAERNAADGKLADHRSSASPSNAPSPRAKLGEDDERDLQVTIEYRRSITQNATDKLRARLAQLLTLEAGTLRIVASDVADGQAGLITTLDLPKGQLVRAFGFFVGKCLPSAVAVMSCWLRRV